MERFSGTYYHKLDAKGKVSLPKAFREALNDKVILTKGLDKFVWVLPPDEWERIMARKARMTPRLKRLLISNKVEVEIDKVGRIQIPQPLRQFAGVENCEVSISGLDNSIEIWERKRKDDADDAVLFDEQTQNELENLLTDGLDMDGDS